MPKEENNKSGKFITTILIGGALGSVAAILFSRKKKKKTISEKVHEILEGKPEREKSCILSKLFRRKE